MTDRLARAQLARAASKLNFAWRSVLPALILLTDDERLPDPIATIGALPRDSLVILRAHSPALRAELARALARIARARRLTWIIAGDARLADETHADGAHFAEREIALAASRRVCRPRWLITCAAHSLGACARAAQAGVDAVLLAPVFATASHRERPALGNLRARMIANLAPLPVYALGGVEARSAARLAGARFAGLAAIGALSVDRESDEPSAVARLAQEPYKPPRRRIIGGLHRPGP